MPFDPFSAKEQMEIASLGTEFALTEIIGAAVGYWLDTKWGTLPWGTVGGAMLGFALGFVRIVQVAKAATKKAQKEQKDGRS